MVIFYRNLLGEGAQDELPQIMLAMDEEAAVLGVNCPADVMFIIDATSSVREVFQESINYVEKVIFRLLSFSIILS